MRLALALALVWGLVPGWGSARVPEWASASVPEWGSALATQGSRFRRSIPTRSSCTIDSYSRPHRVTDVGDLGDIRGVCGGLRVLLDGIAGRYRPAVIGGIGTPGLLARFAVVRKQVVVPGNPVHGGGERVDVQPALVETIGKIPCFSHETRILTGEDSGPRTSGQGNTVLVSGESRKCRPAGVTGVAVAAAGPGPDWSLRRCFMIT